MWRSNSTRRRSFWLSPIGFLGRFGRKSSETLGFSGKWRKRHAETIEPSGKSGVSVSDTPSVLEFEKKLPGLSGFSEKGESCLRSTTPDFEDPAAARLARL